MSEGAGQERGMRRLYATALELGPLLLFFVANAKWGIFTGTTVFVAATAVALPCYRWLEKRWPVMPLVGGFFVLVGGLLFLQRPLLKPIFGAAFKLTDEGWRKLTLRWALFFFVLAAVNEVMWRGFSTETWIGSKMFLSFPLTLIFAFLQVPLLKRYWDGEDNPFASGH
jgi:intracellular septation protein